MPGSELLTVYAGEGSSPATTKALEAWLGELAPMMEVPTVVGGQPLYPYRLVSDPHGGVATADVSQRTSA